MLATRQSRLLTCEMPPALADTRSAERSGRGARATAAKAAREGTLDESLASAAAAAGARAHVGDNDIRAAIAPAQQRRTEVSGRVGRWTQMLS